MEDLKSNVEEYKNLERKITIKHQEIISKIYKKFEIRANIIGFHGQTILHKPYKIFLFKWEMRNFYLSYQKQMLFINFRQNDIKNGGQGAPLTPIYHHNLKKLNLKTGSVFKHRRYRKLYIFKK